MSPVFRSRSAVTAARVCGLLAAALLSGCAAMPWSDPAEQLRTRAETFWSARVAGDHLTAYRHEAVSVSDKADLQRYLATRGSIKYVRAEVREVRLLADDNAEVNVLVEYRIPLMGQRNPPIKGDLWDKWRRIDGDWYRLPPRAAKGDRPAPATRDADD